MNINVKGNLKGHDNHMNEYRERQNPWRIDKLIIKFNKKYIINSANMPSQNLFNFF